MTEPRAPLPDGAPRHRALWRPRRQWPAATRWRRWSTLEAPILQVKEARTGETVGYGATQTLPRDSRLAIIAIGYADGFFRALSSTNNRHRRQGRRSAAASCPVVGRVSMDLVALDITDLGAELPRPGRNGRSARRNVSVDDQADAAGTIGYEILTSLKGRYERVFVDSLGASQN